MKSQNSIWVIAVMGLVGMVAFSGLGFWNVKHPLLQVRPYLQKRHQVSVEESKLKRDKRGRLDAVEIIVTEPKELDQDRLRRIGCDAFAWLCDKDDRNDIRRVIVTAPNGESATVARREAELYRSMRSKATIDSIRLAASKATGASIYHLEPLQTEANGTDFLIQIQIPNGKPDDPMVPAAVARRVRRATLDQLDDIVIEVVELKGNDPEVRARVRFDKRNRATKLPLGG